MILLSTADYADFVDDQLGQSQRPLPILAWMMMLEAAEAGNEVKRIATKDKYELTAERREKIIEEMGDTLYYLTAMMNSIGVTMEQVMLSNVKKLEARNGVSYGRGTIYAGYSPVPDVPPAH